MWSGVVALASSCDSELRCGVQSGVESECREERERALQSAGSSPSFVPVCRMDGTFAVVQCQYDTGFCWCVSVNGKPIPGSAVQYARPDCDAHEAARGGRARRGRGRQPRTRQPAKAKSRRPGTRSKGRRRPRPPRSCTQSDRTQFNNHVLDRISDEFNKEHMDGEEEEEDGKTLERHKSDEGAERRREQLRWKFDQMDSDNDGLLRRRELKPFRETIRRVASGSVCGRNLWTYCDMDSDRRLTLREWNECLGLDLNISFRLFMSLSAADEPDEGGRSRSSQRRRLRDERRTNTNNQPANNQRYAPLAMTRETVHRDEEDDEEDDDRPKNCWAKRSAAIASNSEQGSYVPECENDGSFKSIQCYQKSGYCWCVDGPSGRPIVGTSVRDSTPNCEGVNPVSRSRSEAWRKCGEPRKSRFRKALKRFMANAMMANRYVNASPTKELRVARWHFNKLDKNDDAVLSRRELRPFRQQLLEDRRLKLCGKRFQLQCDKDDDRKITLNEWNQCVGVVEESLASLSGPPATRIGNDRSHKRRGPNPLDTYLSAD